MISAHLHGAHISQKDVTRMEGVSARGQSISCKYVACPLSLASTLVRGGDCRSRNDEVWQGVAAEARAKVEEVCKRRGMECAVEQKTAVPAVHSDEALMQDLREAIMTSQKVTSSFNAFLSISCWDVDSYCWNG